MTSPESALAGRTCLVTGATSGIGEATAIGLARLGARVILVGRDPARGEASLARVKRDSGNDDVILLLADLASLAEVRRLAGAVLEQAPALHVLVNNAGVVNLRRETTRDGFETTFAVNHLAYFLLTRLLEERLRASAPARVINVASEGHRFGKLDIDDLQTAHQPYRWMRVYGTSKLANVLFTYELSRRLEGSGVTANCLHPGAVGTGLGANNGRLGKIVLPLLRPFMRSPADGAKTSVYLAANDEVAGVSGRYFIRCRARASSAASRDEGLARRLWDASEALTGPVARASAAVT
jgi:NAD(P)-dependent dehydrogenase (short-subunit alcohol dehydrogenase family)